MSRILGSVERTRYPAQRRGGDPVRALAPSGGAPGRRATGGAVAERDVRFAARLLDSLPRPTGGLTMWPRRGVRCTSVSGFQGCAADSTSLTGRGEATVDSQLPWRRDASGPPLVGSRGLTGTGRPGCSVGYLRTATDQNGRAHARPVSSSADRAVPRYLSSRRRHPSRGVESGVRSRWSRYCHGRRQRARVRAVASTCRFLVSNVKGCAAAGDGRLSLRASCSPVSLCSARAARGP